MQVYLQFDVGIVPTSCSFIKNETLHKCVLCILKNFSAWFSIFVKTMTPAQVFQFEIWKKF